MGKSKIFEMAILGLWLLVVSMLLFRHFASKSQIEAPAASSDPGINESFAGRRLPLKRIVVIDGSNYDITIREGDRRLILSLPVSAVPNVKQQVVSFLNSVTKPEAILEMKRPDGKWSGRILVRRGDAEVDLARWLADSKFVYD